MCYIVFEFIAQGELEAITAVLADVTSSGSFSIEPDRFKKSTNHYRRYNLYIQNPTVKEPTPCGSIELVHKGEGRILVKIREKTDPAERKSISSFSPLDRFFYLFSQRLLQDQMVMFEPAEKNITKKTTPWSVSKSLRTVKSKSPKH